MDRRSISATLTLALLGCASGNSAADKPNTDSTAEPTATAAVTAMETSAPSAEANSAPTSTATAEPTAAASAELGAPPPEVKAKLPEGRTQVKGQLPATGSKRTGAGACCGVGTCAPCVAPKESKRTGKTNCCGAGTCSPC